MKPVQDAAARVGANLAAASTALDTWASTVQPIVQNLQTLKADPEAFEQSGGGIQFKLPRSVEWHIDHGYLREVVP